MNHYSHKGKIFQSWVSFSCQVSSVTGVPSFTWFSALWWWKRPPEDFSSSGMRVMLRRVSLANLTVRKPSPKSSLSVNIRSSSTMPRRWSTKYTYTQSMNTKIHTIWQHSKDVSKQHKLMGHYIACSTNKNQHSTSNTQTQHDNDNPTLSIATILKGLVYIPNPPKHQHTQNSN